MRAFAAAAVVLAGILAFPAATVIAGNKGGAGKSWGSSSSGHASVEGRRNTNGPCLYGCHRPPLDVVVRDFAE